MIDMLVWMKNMEEPMYMMWVYADTHYMKISIL